MSEILMRYATAAAAALFAVVAVTGVMMFFHVDQGFVGEMHEWLALVFVAAAAVHVWRNWGGFKTYVRRRTLVVPTLITGFVALAFLVPAMLGGGGKEPVPRVFNAIENARLADIATLIGAEGGTLETALVAKGFKVGSADQRVSEIARQSDKPAMLAVRTIIEAFPETR